MLSSASLSHQSLTAPGALGEGILVPGFTRCGQLCGISLLFVRGRSRANMSWCLDTDLVPLLASPCNIIFALNLFGRTYSKR